jgi:transmembrane sensor
LDDPDRALRLIAASFPGLRVRTLTPYLVLVER